MSLDVEDLFRRLNETDQVELTRLARTVTENWIPQPGPQTVAYFCDADELLYGGSAGGGKALACDTPILTRGGWKDMGQLEAGDVVFDERGMPCNVLAVSPVMIGRPCYRVTFSDGSEIVADADHLWLTETADERLRALRQTARWRDTRKAKRPTRGLGKKPRLGERNKARAAIKELPLSSIRTTREIAETLLQGKHLNHAVPVSKPVQHDTTELPIDPYVLGAWLGDGSSYKAELTSADLEVVEQFEAAGHAMTHRGRYAYGVSNLCTRLKAVGVMRNKHIPDAYLRGSVEQRLALLQGLMDTDGYADPRGQCEFTTTNELMAFQVQELLNGLGIKAAMSVGRAMLKGKDCGAKFRIKFLTELPAFRLTRKLERQKREGFRGTANRRYIASCEPVPSVPVRCIQVDSPSRLYLASKSCVPTHNSDLLVGYAVNEAHNAVIFRNGLKNVRDLENRAIAVLKSRSGFNGQFHTFDLGGGRSLELDSLEQPGSEQNWQGRRRDFFGFDEAAQMSKTRIQFVLGWAGSAKAGARTRVIYATNPPLSDEGNWLITWFSPWLDPMAPRKAKAGELRWFVNDKDGDPVWVDGPGQYDRGDGVMSTAKSRTFIPSSLADNAYLRDTDYRSRVEALPEPMRSAMLTGNFMAARKDDAMQVLPSAWIRAAQARWTPDGDKEPMIAIGTDVAGGGDDSEAIAALHARNWFAPVKLHEGVDTKNGPATAGRIVACQRNGAPIGIDMTGGWGGAAKQALTDAQVDAYGVVFSTSSGARDPNTKIEYYNLRAELYWSFRLALDPNGTERIQLPPDARVLAEGTAPRWRLQGGKILIEAKDEIRKRLGSSTDVFDAIVIAWAMRNKGLTKQRQGAPARQPMVEQESDPFALDGF